MNKFEDYNASQIVPQKTLLEKFNKLIEYVKTEKSINIFLSNENYELNKTIYNINNVVLNDYKLHNGDIVCFKNGYYSYVNFIGLDSYQIGEIRYFVGEQGVGIESIQLNSSNQFVITLTDGTIQVTDPLPIPAVYLHPLTIYTTGTGIIIDEKRYSVIGSGMILSNTGTKIENRLTNLYNYIIGNFTRLNVSMTIRNVTDNRNIFVSQLYFMENHIYVIGIGDNGQRYDESGLQLDLYSGTSDIRVVDSVNQIH